MAKSVETEMTKPNAPLVGLEKLEGKWTAAETLFASRYGSEEAGEATSAITASLILGGTFLRVEYAQTRDGKVSFEGHAMCGWSPAKERFLLYWFASGGQPPLQPSLGAWEGEVLTFHARNLSGRNSRFALSLEDSNRPSYRIDESTDGVSWTPLLEGELQRKRRPR
jgi:hypothetical protein